MSGASFDPGVSPLPRADAPGDEARLALENALREQTRLAALTRDISLALTRQQDSHAMLRECVETVVAHLGAAFARIWTLNEAAQVLELQASAGMYTHVNGPHGRVPVGKFKIGLIAEERQPHLTNDVQTDPRIGDPDWARREGMVAFAGYPLLVGDALVGVLAMFARRRLSEADFSGLGTVANALALGIARARADAAIRASAEHYRFLAEVTPTHVWTATPAGEMEYANSQAREYFGFDPVSATPADRQSLVHPDDRTAATGHWQRAIASGEPLEFESRLRRHDAEYRWHIVRARALRDASGGVAKWFGTNTDVHDLKLARLALTARADELTRLADELRYQRDLTTTITNNTASGLFMMDADGRPLFINDAACAMTGYAGLADLAGRRLHDAIHACTARAVCAFERAGVDAVPLRTHRDVLCRKDGSRFPVELNLAPIVRHGRPVGSVLEVRDITQEIAAEQALRTSDERFHLLARATNDTIWDWNLETNALWWNDNFTAMFGFPRDQVEPTIESWTSRIHPDDLARVTATLHAALDGDAEIWSDEYRFRRADGNWAAILDRGIIVRDAEGRSRRMIGSMMDISERHRTEAELRRHAEHLTRLTAALERTNRDLDQFAYVASHDLKAPLRGISNLAQWIEEDLGGDLPEATRGHLKLMRNRVARMEGLIDGVLHYSRAGRTSGDPERVAVRRIVADVLDLLAPPSEIRFEIDDGLPVLFTHRLLLQQVLLNLIGNAVKYGVGHAQPVIRIGARTEDGVTHFTVADNGTGIDPAFHDRIWGIFQTLQPRDEVEGTGIGLALVKKIVEGRGGRIWIESRPGEGAAFHFTWPHAAGDAHE